MKCYVLMRPDGVGEIFDAWEACRDRLKLFPGAPHQAVDSREKAQTMINGGIVLPAGTYVFAAVKELLPQNTSSRP